MSPKKKPGRKSKLTPERHRTVINAMTLGNYVTTAARLAGVDNDTVHRWVQRGEERPASIYGQFAQDFREATATAESRHVTTIAKAASLGEWRASAWWLERRFPKRWGEQQKIEHKHELTVADLIASASDGDNETDSE